MSPGAGKESDGLEALRTANYRKILDEMDRIGPGLRGARVLEVGCARGCFLEAAVGRGARVLGIEPDPENSQIARDRGLEVVTGFFPDDLGGRRPFDAIVFNDVFEHLPDPGGAIRQVESLLASGGLVVVNLPSRTGTIYRIARWLDFVGYSGPFERLWQRGFPSPHLSYFDPQTLALLVQRHTDLAAVASFPLPAIHRSGLRSRIRTTTRGIGAEVQVFASLAFSLVAWLLPSDIVVGIFRADPEAGASEAIQAGDRHGSTLPTTR